MPAEYPSPFFIAFVRLRRATMTHLNTFDTVLIINIFVIVIGCFLASVVWRLYVGGRNDVPD